MTVLKKFFLSRYSIALSVVLLSIAIRLILHPILQDSAPFLIFGLAIIISAWYGGSGPAILSTILTAIAAIYLFIHPFNTFSILTLRDFTWVSIFIIQGLLISFIVELMHRSRREAEQLAHEAKVSEERLRVSEERLQLAQKVAGAGTWDWDLKTNKIEWSNEYYEVFGLDPLEVEPSYETWLASILEEDRDKTIEAINNVINKGEIRYWEYRIIHPNKGVRWIYGTGQVFYDEDKRPSRMIGLVIDITERNLAESRLKESILETAHTKAQLETVFQAVGDGIVVFDMQGNAILVNDAEAEICGYRSGEEMKQDLPYFASVFELSTLDGEIVPLADWPVAKVLQGRSIDEWELCGKRLDTGQEWIFSFSAKPVFNEQNEQILAVVTTRDITSIKRVELSERETAEMFQTLADNIAQLAWMADEKGWLFWYNKRWFDYTGTTLEEMKGWGWQKVHHPDYVDQVTEKFKCHVQLGEIWEDTFPLRGVDGIYRWFLSRAIPIRDQEGRVLRWFGTNTDITEQRRIEEALRYSEERLRATFDNAGVGIVEVEGDDHFIAANDRVCEILGYSREELLGRTVHELTSPEDRKQSDEINAAIHEGRIKRISYEKRYLKRDGSSIWVQVTVSGVYDKNGKWLRSIITIEDISERKAAEESLREATALLTALSETTPDPLFAKDIHGRMLWANPATLHAIGKPAEEVLGRNESEWLDDPKQAAIIMANDRRIIETGQSQVVEEEMIGPQGTRVYLGTKSPLRDEHGNIVGIVGLSRDITDRKRMEQERELLLVREQEVRAESERANRMKDEFLATLSHELRTPLTSILGWARMLQGGQLNTEYTRKAIETIARNAEAQSQLIEDLLEVSRLVTGKIKLEVAEIDLRAVVQSAINTVKLSAEAKRINLTAHISQSVSTVVGDPNRLQQVIWNLLTNAIKFTPEGGEVRVKVEQADSFIELEVTDTGQGIKAELLPYVFERFRQADSSITRKYGGLGLGLAIVKQLVELHGGTVEAESGGEGRGSTFRVRIPVREKQILERMYDGSHERRRDMAQHLLTISSEMKLHGTTVLIVEDEISTRELVKFILEESGAKVVDAKSAIEGLEVVMESVPDIIISDLGMPEMDGYELMRKVRMLPSDKGGAIPAIALTAYARTEDRVRVMEAGYQMHISKPVEPIELITAAANLIKQTRRGASTANR